MKLKSLVASLAFLVVISFCSMAFAAELPSELFRYVPDSSIFFAYSKNLGDAYNNYIGHGIELAIPRLRIIRESYEKAAGTTIAQDAALSAESVIALTDINITLFSFEFVQVVRVTDTKAFENMLEKSLGVSGISRKNFTKISGHEVFSLSSPEIKTPLFYLFNGTHAIFSNKLEGLSKSLDQAFTASKNFSKTSAFEQICRKYPLDSNFYFWLNGKVITNYLSTLNLVGMYPAFMKTDENVKLEKMVRIINDFARALEFIAIKVNVGQRDIEIDFFVALNELLAKTIKARLQFVKTDDHKSLSYEGIQPDSLRLVPEKANFAATAHVVLPPVEELNSAPIANTSDEGGLSMVSFKVVNDRLIKKYGAGVEKLVYSWAADEFFVAGTEGRGIMAGAKIKNADNLEAVLKTVEKKVAQTGYRKSSSKYSDIKITLMKKSAKKGEPEKTRAYFTTDNYFVITDSLESAKAAIDAYLDKKPSIRASADFVKACNYVKTDKYKVIAYSRTSSILDAAAPYLNSMLDITTVEPQLMNLRNLGIVNYVTRDGQHLKIKLTY